MRLIDADALGIGTKYNGYKAERIAEEKRRHQIEREHSD